MKGKTFTLIIGLALAGGENVGNQARQICSSEGSEHLLVPHEHCNQYFRCLHREPILLSCPADLLYNVEEGYCDCKDRVNCGDRLVPDSQETDEDTDEGSGNSNPDEAPEICAKENSVGILVAHENCNQFYKCDHGVPVAFKCYGDLLFNPATGHCDWPDNVECGDRIIPDSEENGDDGNGDNNNVSGENGGNENGGKDGGNGSGNGNGNGQGNGNCNPAEVPEICAAEGSEGTLVAHENCNQFYKCANGKPVALKCSKGLLYNPQTEQCDWPDNVDCGERVISDSSENENNGNGDSSEPGNGNETGENGNGNTGPCNCKPEEAPLLCAAADSDGIHVAHENCNQFYTCAAGRPVVQNCPGQLLYNPYSDKCDWPENVECGDRIIPDCEDGGNGNGGVGGENGSGNGNGNGQGNGNGNSAEAPEICAADGSEGTLVAHENCNQFYKCANGKPVASKCPGNLLYNPQIEQCDWPDNVDCGERVISDSSENENNGNGDSNESGNGNETGENGNGDTGPCNCKPEEAPLLCAADNSDGIHVAHENCNQFYTCSAGRPVVQSCPGALLYNPYSENCDWPENIECGNRVIPDCEGNNDNNNCSGGSNENSSDNNGNGNENGQDGNSGPCNCKPEEAPLICATNGSDGVHVASEICNRFYTCADGKPVEQNCPSNLLYNPYTVSCDWPENVDCGDRVIVPCEGDKESNENKDSNENNTVEENGTDREEAKVICSDTSAEGKYLPHKNCNQFYACSGGQPVVLTCFGGLLYDPDTWNCDWPANVKCGNRTIPDAAENSLNKHLLGRLAFTR